MATKTSKAEQQRRALIVELTERGFFPSRLAHPVIYAHSSPAELPGISLPAISLPDDIPLPLRSTKDAALLPAHSAKIAKGDKKKLKRRASRRK